MSEKHINKLNVNPFLGGIIMQAFYFGYEEQECPILLHYIILPMVLFGEIRKPLLTINKNATFTNFVSQNRISFVGFQESIWTLKKLTNSSLMVLHNKQQIILRDTVEIRETIDYSNYNDDMKKYLRASAYLGMMLKKETIQDIYKILKVIP